ncbi:MULTISPECIES: nuclear transport factor 2 family protein [unclassified Vibrio]|uniref:nuclear transport factor 2 family protein n=1 Tax=unclassified Vibrio TaxID=2614977 RepID=UPI001483AB0C|nr:MULTISPECIES: nuclear transport factor 2 family protein [unclassified Vibrio]NNN44997.1 nuclear transport factor 2 family protein [Vibrio sp. 1-1(7)]NNN72370.1 nuclear transport factor 2 family protein [Vibrio sp. 12-2(3-a)]
MSLSIQHQLSDKNESEQCAILSDILNRLFIGDIAVETLFRADYQQNTDGKTLDLVDFKQHVSFLRQHVSKIQFNVVDVCLHENRLGERHFVTITHLDQTESQLEVYMFIRFRDQKIESTHEVTRLISGNIIDRELASAVA